MRNYVSFSVCLVLLLVSESPTQSLDTLYPCLSTGIDRYDYEGLILCLGGKLKEDPGDVNTLISYTQLSKIARKPDHHTILL